MGVAILGLIFAALGAVAAIFAAYFAWKAPTKEDLERVEQHTAATSMHLAGVLGQLQEQKSRDELIARANRLAIAVEGQGQDTNPLRLSLMVKEPNIPFIHVEFFNQLGTLFGSASSSPSGPRLSLLPLTLMQHTSGSEAERWMGTFPEYWRACVFTWISKVVRSNPACAPSEHAGSKQCAKQTRYGIEKATA